MDVALKSITLWAAYQHYEETNRGSIEAGKLADFVILDKNPLKVRILELAELKVMETLKRGRPSSRPSDHREDAVIAIHQVDHPNKWRRHHSFLPMGFPSRLGLRFIRVHGISIERPIGRIE